jgi:carboxyl-terminal processing protease
MATETRGLKTLPLNEKERVALRDSQEQKALEIENKRREAQGLEPLDSLREETAEATSDAAEDEDVAVDDNEALNTLGNVAEDAEAVSEADEAEDEAGDVLLIEAGRILADVLALTGASNNANSATAQR